MKRGLRMCRAVSRGDRARISRATYGHHHVYSLRAETTHWLIQMRDTKKDQQRPQRLI